MKILMIALDYHAYTQAIENEFRNAGHEVVRHSIVPDAFAIKALKLHEPTYLRAVARYHSDILARERGNGYDWVFFLQCHYFSRSNLEAYRSAFAGARFTLYNWDSIRTHDYLPYRDLFDDIYTFDPHDAEAENLRYLPLFCIRDFQGIRRSAKSDPAVYVIGNVAAPGRYLMVEAFRKYCREAGIPIQVFLKAGLLGHIKLRRAIPAMRGVSWRSIKHDRFLQMMASSTATFDFANHSQVGMTMRVVENLCAGLKIITSNHHVLDKPFYSPDRIHLYHGADFSGVRDFLETPLADPDADFPEYHIQTFARHLIEGTQHVRAARPREAVLRSGDGGNPAVIEAV
jgi:hypothetical protein